jgi:hypothetical protein
MHIIYKLFYTNSSHVYIGTTTRSLNARVSQHFTALRAGTHHSVKLQKAYEVLGIPEAIEIDTTTSKEEAQYLEKYWIEQYNSFKAGYNNTVGGEGTGTGEESPTSKYTLDDYLCVLSMLAHTNLTAEEISLETSVSVHVIRHISSGKAHGYLQELSPAEYTLVLNKNRLSQHYYKVYPKVVSPTGQVYEFYNANQFCKEHDIKQGNFVQLLNGKAKSCRGWKLADAYEIPRAKSTGPYKLLDPTGQVVEILNLSKFAKENNLDSGSLSRLINNKCNSHKGYRKYKG